MFIRTKRIKKYEYAYIVNNVWTRKGSRQRVSEYLGRVHELKRTKDIGFGSFVRKPLQEYLTDKSYLEVLHDLVQWELARHGFRHEDNIWRSAHLDLELSKNVTISDRIVLQMNEGFLCNHTLECLKGFQPVGEEEEVVYDFAESFVLAGIAVPKDVFIALYQKIVNNTKKIRSKRESLLR